MVVTIALALLVEVPPSEATIRPYNFLVALPAGTNAPLVPPESTRIPFSAAVERVTASLIELVNVRVS
jgi:hypothetical protein